MSCRIVVTTFTRCRNLFRRHLDDTYRSWLARYLNITLTNKRKKQEGDDVEDDDDFFGFGDGNRYASQQASRFGNENDDFVKSERFDDRIGTCTVDFVSFFIILVAVVVFFLCIAMTTQPPPNGNIG